jgi:hypothetical protein
MENRIPEFHRSFSGAPWGSRVGYCRSLSRLIDPDMLIEIEADAIVTN